MIDLVADTASQHELAQRIGHALAEYSSRSAVIDNGRAYSFAELAQMVQIVAARLGSEPGAVAVDATSSVYTIAALLGCLFAGGTYCPINPSFPPQRQTMMADAAGCRLWIGTSGDPQPAWKKGYLDGVTLCKSSSAIAADNELTVAPQEQPAYVLFTSGSTGTPKGVLTPRGAVLAATCSLVSLLDIQSADRILQFASLSWDTCFEEILPALMCGAALVIDRDASSGSIARLLAMLRLREVSVLNLPTAFWHEVVYYLKETGSVMPSGVRIVVVGGESVRTSVLADWCSVPHTDRMRLVNTYGCTETTLVTHAIDLHGPQADYPVNYWAGGRIAPIGFPMRHVVESVSADGELMIGGPSLALGYLADRTLTNARFAKDGSRRLYRTGDRVFRDERGALVHLGRLDNEVKIRGIRVNLAEVERIVSDHPRVASAAVVSIMFGQHTALAAYVVLKEEPPHAQVSQILADLKAKVPGHLVPTKLKIVPNLVRTASGKVDRRMTHERYRIPTAINEVRK